MTTTNVRILALSAIFAVAACAQTAISTTTLSIAVANGRSQTVNVASATGILAPGFAQSQGGIGSVVGGPNITMLYVDRELMRVNSVNGTLISVNRGSNGTAASSHVNGATVYLGPSTYFHDARPWGACTASQLNTLPWIVTPTGDFWTCPTSGPTSGMWTKSGNGDTTTFADGKFDVPFSDCVTSASGNTTGTNGASTTGASGTPVQTVHTSITGTNTQTYICAVAVPQRLTAGKGVALTDVTFYYGVQTAAIGTQSATLASGTLNGSIVFSTVAMPAAGATETASAVTPVRADAGTMVITPAVASANVNTTTAGAFYSMKIAPATPFLLNADRSLLYVTITLQMAGTTDTITNSPGLTVHYTSVI